MSAQSDFPPPDHEPTRALLLAQALDACIEAERQVPGSADHVIARQPAWARAELRRLVALAGSLDAAATGAVMSEEFRVAARARLMRRIAGTHAPQFGDSARANGHTPVHPIWLTTLPPPGAASNSASASVNRHVSARRRRPRGWLWRSGAGGLLASVLVMAATLNASASALPGEPLYGLKQAREELNLRLAPNDDARTLLLLRQADTRLDEASRLLQQGRTQQVAETTQRFDDVLDRATTTYVVTIADAQSSSTSDAAASQTIESKLSQQQQQLQMLLATAPEPARADLREALVTTQRSRALVADPKPAEEAARPAPAAAAPEPTAEAEPEPTRASAAAKVAPPPVDLLEQKPTATEVVIVADGHDRDDVVVEHALSGPASALGRGPSMNAQAHDRQDDARAADPPRDMPNADDRGSADAGRGNADHANSGGPPPRVEPPRPPAPVAVAPRERGPNVSVRAEAQPQVQAQQQTQDDGGGGSSSSSPGPDEQARAQSDARRAREVDAPPAPAVVADARANGDTRGAQASQNQQDGRGRVAQQPAITPQTPSQQQQQQQQQNGGDAPRNAPEAPRTPAVAVAPRQPNNASATANTSPNANTSPVNTGNNQNQNQARARATQPPAANTSSNNNNNDDHHAGGNGDGNTNTPRNGASISQSSTTGGARGDNSTGGGNTGRGH